MAAVDQSCSEAMQRVTCSEWAENAQIIIAGTNDAQGGRSEARRGAAELPRGDQDEI